jgi:hypothetical protein
MAALGEHLPAVPSVRRWLAGLRETLAERRSAIVVMPASLDPRPICDALRLELERIRGEWPAEVDLRDVARGDPAATLAAAFGLAGPYLTLEALLTSPELPAIITVLGVDELPPPARAGWLEFLARVASLSQARAGAAHFPSFLLLARGEAILADLPPTNVRLAIEWWWGIPSLVELRVLLRGVDDGVDRCRETWREHLLPSLAGADIDLAGHLLEDALFDGQELLECRLASIFTRRNWPNRTAAMRTVRPTGADRRDVSGYGA